MGWVGNGLLSEGKGGETLATPTTSNPNRMASCLMAWVRADIGKLASLPTKDYRLRIWELEGCVGVGQLNMTLKRAEHWSVVQIWHVPTIVVFQSVCARSNWHVVLPPLETSAQGSAKPGYWATVH